MLPASKLDLEGWNYFQLDQRSRKKWASDWSRQKTMKMSDFGGMAVLDMVNRIFSWLNLKKHLQPIPKVLDLVIFASVDVSKSKHYRVRSLTQWDRSNSSRKIRDDSWMLIWLMVQEPSWKIWVRQWEGWHPIYEMENKKCVKPPTSHENRNKFAVVFSKPWCLANSNFESQIQQLINMFTTTTPILCSSFCLAKLIPPCQKINKCYPSRFGLFPFLAC